jgi:hypothetical protein
MLKTRFSDKLDGRQHLRRGAGRILAGAGDRNVRADNNKYRRYWFWRLSAAVILEFGIYWCFLRAVPDPDKDKDAYGRADNYHNPEPDADKDDYADLYEDSHAYIHKDKRNDAHFYKDAYAFLYKNMDADLYEDCHCVLYVHVFTFLYKNRYTVPVPFRHFYEDA